MKKTKKFGKTQVALAVMVVALAAAVGLNMKYSAEGNGTQNDASSKYLGQADYVNASVEGQTDENTEDKYFSDLRKDRLAAREEALDIIEETLENKDLSEEQKNAALERSAAIARAAEQEAGIETILKAKGFGNVVAVIGETDVNIIVDGEPDSAKIAQIQDAVIAQTDFTAADIKIITAENK